MRTTDASKFYLSNLLPRICRYLNGLEKAILFYRSGDNNSIAAAYTDRSMIYQTSILPDKVNIDSLRRKRTGGPQRWMWYDRNQLEFDQKRFRPEENNLLTPLSESVLLLFLPTGSSTDFDLLYLFFSGNVSYLNPVQKNDEHFFRQTKDAIGSLLSGIFTEMFYEEAERDIQNSRFKRLIKGVSVEVEHLRHSLSEVKMENQERIFKYCIDRLKVISDEKSRTVTFHDSSKKKLLLYTGDIAALDEIISNAVFFAESLSDDLTSPLLIKDFHIQHSKEINSENNRKLVTIQNLSEATSYLDRLEDAGSIIHTAGGKLTGASMGEVMNPPITPSAISQWLTKYGNQMVQLLHTYPDKWHTIRNHFKPLVKILQRDNSGEMLEMTGS